MVLIRHGESVVTVNRVVGGPLSCVGLSDLGRQQAERLRDRLASTEELASQSPLTLYSSAYPRAQETAEIIAPALNVDKVVVEEGFGEQDPGPECDGLTFENFLERHGRPRWDHNPFGVFFPGGESVAAFDLRIGTTLVEVLARHPGETVVITCHGGVVDRALRQFLNAPRSGVFELFTRNTSVTEFKEVEVNKWRLVRYNDAAHLAGLPSSSAKRPLEGEA